jgi:hypothetical protein
MFNYSLDFPRFGSDMLPPYRRKTRFKDLLVVLTSQIKTLFQKFAGGSGLIEVMRDRVSFTGQVIYLETLLRRQFCNGAELITIVDGVSIAKTFVPKKTDALTIYLPKKGDQNPIYLFTKSEFNSNADFIVWVDPSVNFIKSDMQAILNYYKPAGKNYLIKIIGDE